MDEAFFREAMGFDIPEYPIILRMPISSSATIECFDKSGNLFTYSCENDHIYDRTEDLEHFTIFKTILDTIKTMPMLIQGPVIVPIIKSKIILNKLPIDLRKHVIDNIKNSIHEMCKETSYGYNDEKIIDSYVKCDEEVFDNTFSDVDVNKKEVSLDLKEDKKKDYLVSKKNEVVVYLPLDKRVDFKDQFKSDIKSVKLFFDNISKFDEETLDSAFIYVKKCLRGEKVACKANKNPHGNSTNGILGVFKEKVPLYKTNKLDNILRIEKTLLEETDPEIIKEKFKDKNILVTEEDVNYIMSHDVYNKGYIISDNYVDIKQDFKGSNGIINKKTLPLFIKGMTPSERFRQGDGKQYIHGGIYKWLLCLSSMDFTSYDIKEVSFWMAVGGIYLLGIMSNGKRAGKKGSKEKVNIKANFEIGSKFLSKTFSSDCTDIIDGELKTDFYLSQLTFDPYDDDSHILLDTETYFINPRPKLKVGLPFIEGKDQNLTDFSHCSFDIQRMYSCLAMSFHVLLGRDSERRFNFNGSDAREDLFFIIFNKSLGLLKPINSALTDYLCVLPGYLGTPILNNSDEAVSAVSWTGKNVGTTIDLGSSSLVSKIGDEIVHSGPRYLMNNFLSTNFLKVSQAEKRQILTDSLVGFGSEGEVKLDSLVILLDSLFNNVSKPLPFHLMSHFLEIFQLFGHNYSDIYHVITFLPKYGERPCRDIEFGSQRPNINDEFFDEKNCYHDYKKYALEIANEVENRATLNFNDVVAKGLTDNTTITSSGSAPINFKLTDGFVKKHSLNDIGSKAKTKNLTSIEMDSLQKDRNTLSKLTENIKKIDVTSSSFIKENDKIKKITKQIRIFEEKADSMADNSINFKSNSKGVYVMFVGSEFCNFDLITSKGTVSFPQANGIRKVALRDSRIINVTFVGTQVTLAMMYDIMSDMRNTEGPTVLKSTGDGTINEYYTTPSEFAGPSINVSTMLDKILPAILANNHSCYTSFLSSKHTDSERLEILKELLIAITTDFSGMDQHTQITTRLILEALRKKITNSDECKKWIMKCSSDLTSKKVFNYNDYSNLSNNQIGDHIKDGYLVGFIPSRTLFELSKIQQVKFRTKLSSDDAFNIRLNELSVSSTMQSVFKDEREKLKIFKSRNPNSVLDFNIQETFNTNDTVILFTDSLDDNEVNELSNRLSTKSDTIEVEIMKVIHEIYASTTGSVFSLNQMEASSKISNNNFEFKSKKVKRRKYDKQNSFIIVVPNSSSHPMHEAEHNTSGNKLTEISNTIISIIVMTMPGVKFLNAWGDDIVYFTPAGAAFNTTMKGIRRAAGLGQIIKESALGGGEIFTYLRGTCGSSKMLERIISLSSEHSKGMKVNPLKCNGVVAKIHKAGLRMQDESGTRILVAITLALSCKWSDSGWNYRLPIGYGSLGGSLPAVSGDVNLKTPAALMGIPWIKDLFKDCPLRMVVPDDLLTSNKALAKVLTGQSELDSGFSLEAGIIPGVHNFTPDKSDIDGVNFKRDNTIKLKGSEINNQVHKSVAAFTPDEVIRDTLLQEGRVLSHMTENRSAVEFLRDTSYSRQLQRSSASLIAMELANKNIGVGKASEMSKKKFLIIGSEEKYRRLVFTFSESDKTLAFNLSTNGNYDGIIGYATASMSQYKSYEPLIYASSSPLTSLLSLAVGSGKINYVGGKRLVSYDSPHYTTDEIFGILSSFRKLLNLHDDALVVSVARHINLDLDSQDPKDIRNAFNLRTMASMTSAEINLHYDLECLESQGNYNGSGITESFTGSTIFGSGLVTCDDSQLRPYMKIFNNYLTAMLISVWGKQYNNESVPGQGNKTFTCKYLRMKVSLR